MVDRHAHAHAGQQSINMITKVSMQTNSEAIGSIFIRVMRGQVEEEGEGMSL